MNFSKYNNFIDLYSYQFLIYVFLTLVELFQNWFRFR